MSPHDYFVVKAKSYASKEFQRYTWEFLNEREATEMFNKLRLDQRFFDVELWSYQRLA